MNQIFIKALEQLTEPIAILALLLMVVVILLARTIAKQLPKINMTLGKLVTLIELLVYDRGDKK